MRGFSRLPIRWKITFLSIAIVFLVLIAFVARILVYGSAVEERERGQRALLVAQSVAAMPTVQEALLRPDGHTLLQPVVERIRVVNQVDYIVVLNMDRVRYTHPLSSRIGTRLEAADAGPAFAEHTYLSKEKGVLGTAVRAFVPVIDRDGRQIGVVLVGVLLPTWGAMLAAVWRELAVTAGAALLLGAAGSWLLAWHIKRQIYNLEPYQIAQLFEERMAVFNAIHEGIVAIDAQERITIINEAAKRLLGITGNPVGQPIRAVIPDTRLPEILHSGKPVFGQEIRVRGAHIVSTRVPIRSGGRVVGAVGVFQDRTDVHRLAEELTGVKALVDALRAQNHEHLNKLHTLAGLIQLGQTREALSFITQTTQEQEALSRFVLKRIGDPAVAGVLLGKVSRGRERGIRVVLDEASCLETLPDGVSSYDLVVVLGNLLENAMDALETVSQKDKEVYVRIDQTPDALSITVADNGPGIPAALLSRMFERGFTTTGDPNRGIGLSLVREIVENAGGEIAVDSAVGEGTVFHITLPMRQPGARPGEGGGENHGGHSHLAG
ncbi:ATP-binding protein [Calditerricola satsumensis]|uniref:histidine kinase n=1 Tax=Calditerricola satsumensis TaxID=373054 RepID=A0A8J3B7V6_9BACI|nr:sensor histidine kinase [Calditerricola satsumensis]GGK02012.1 putative C4-dicarboxylate sensor kinase [Calditerricola satsumensis]